MRHQTPIEERWNAITHGFGFILSLAGFVLLLVFQKYDSFQGVLAVFLYGLSLSALYFASTMYHWVTNERRKQIFRKLDHIGIYLLIAGTYSPVVLIALEDSMGWTLFWLVWSIAAFGTVLKVFLTGRFEVLSVLLYLIMGWLIVFDYSALTKSVDAVGLWLLIGGGLAYTLGIVFYALDKLKFSHVIWHLFVLAGSVLHYLFILLSVI